MKTILLSFVTIGSLVGCALDMGDDTPAPDSEDIATTEQALGPAIWYGDYETGNLSQWHVGPDYWLAGTSFATVTTSPVRQGKYAGRFEVQTGVTPPGDDEDGNVHNKSEVSSS